ncbi:hypothetical protein ABZ860_31275 [Microbispora sp. NPDC046973]|uniref:hypothetical protein n=1 Tax=Microbispora sp. NPDC046973 TaxID=3155022 RepID=UPI003402BBF6
MLPAVRLAALRLRTAALLGIMLTEGVRVSEICSADVADLGYNRGWRTDRPEGVRPSPCVVVVRGCAAGGDDRVGKVRRPRV